MQKRAFSQVAQHALVGAGVGGALGAGVGYLRGDPGSKGKSMLTHGLVGAATGGLVGAGSGFHAQNQSQNAPFPNVNPLDPSAAKRMDRIKTVLRGYNNIAPDVHKHMDEYAGLAQSANLNQQQVERMRALSQQYGSGTDGNPEHVANFFRAAAHRYEPKVAVAAYTLGMDYAFDVLGM